MALTETGDKSPITAHSRSLVKRPKGAEWVLVAIVIGYAALLLGGPLVAIAWGAISSGFGAMIHALSSREAALHNARLKT